MSYSWREFQGLHQFHMHRTAVDATQAATTVLVDTITLPQVWSKIELKYIGATYAANTGALTTPAVVSLEKVLKSDGSATEIGTVTLVTAKLKGEQTETDQNDTTGTAKYNTLPDFEEVDLSLYYLRFVVKTQGVGGTQSIMPYFIYRIIPTTLS